MGSSSVGAPARATNNTFVLAGLREMRLAENCPSWAD
jgi:hypothetical protein